MRLRNFIAGAFALAAMASLPGKAISEEPKILVLVNASNNTSVDAAKLRNIYLGSVTFWDNGTKIMPLQRSDESDAGKRFFSDVLKMAPSRYRHHWQTQELSGQGVEPDTSESVASLVARVAARPGAVGYILDSEKSEANNPKVRVLPLE